MPLIVNSFKILDMEKRKEIKGIVYLSLIALAVLASLLYGNLLDANIGDFLAYKVFGDSLQFFSLQSFW